VDLAKPNGNSGLEVFMTSYTLDAYSDEELGRMIRAAVSGRAQEARQQTSSRTALAAFLRLVGLGQLADGVIVAAYIWERVKRLFLQLFSRQLQASAH
jgi:hypothetical protein